MKEKSDVRRHPHFEHLFKVGVMLSKVKNPQLSEAAREEARLELLRYRDEGLILQSTPKEHTVAKKTRTHEEDKRVYSGQGILFSVIDDRESMRLGRASTVDIISEAMESAMDAGMETTDEIARYITTSAFNHVTDRRLKFNSVLKAGDVVGAQMVRKLFNSYNDLAQTAEDSEDPKDKAALQAEASGFAAAVQIVLSPFCVEDETDERLVNWDEVDRLTALFEKEQRFVRRERKGNPV